MDAMTTPNDTVARAVIKFKAKKFPDMQFTFSTTGSPYSQGINIGKEFGVDTKDTQVPLTRTITLAFRTKRSVIDMRETLIGPEDINDYTASVCVKVSDLDVIANKNEDGSWVLRFALKPDKAFEVIIDGRKEKSGNFLDVARAGMVLANNQVDIERCSQLQIFLPKGYELAAQDIELCQEIIGGGTLDDPKSIPRDWYRLQNDAINDEDAVARSQKNKMRRTGVQVKFGGLTTLRGRVFVELRSSQPNDKWVLDEQSTIIFEGKTEEGTSLFDGVPTVVPGSPDASGWVGTTFHAGGLTLAVIENSLRSMTGQIRTSINHGWYNGITVRVDEEDPLIVRMRSGINHVRHIMEHQDDPSLHNDDPQMPVDYQLQLAGFFLESRQLESNVHPVVFQNGTSHPTFHAHHQMDTETQKNAVINSLTDATGMGLIQGPPACGKTTVCASLLGIILEQVDLGRDMIVVTAQTNDAVHVIAKRTAEALRVRFRFNPEDKMCIIQSENKLRFNVLIDKGTDRTLKPLLFSSHLKRITDENPERWTAYRSGSTEIEQGGRIEDKVRRGEFREQYLELCSELRNRNDVKIIFTTLSGCHPGEAFFCGVERSYKFPCFALLIDEASQATPVGISGAVAALNPGRIIMAGDHQQLRPFSSSSLGLQAWHTSLFEILMTKVVSPTVLDKQYRTRTDIYAGTQWHYKTPITTSRITIDRPLYKTLMQAIGRITFEDANKKVFGIQKECHFFDIINTDVILAGPNQSSASTQERNFVFGLIFTLFSAGVPLKEIMAITGYQAMYDWFFAMEKYMLTLGLRLNKIDSSQGDEAGIVVLSMCRNLTTGLGFLKTRNRMNVGTSRARDGFYIVGNWKTCHQYAGSEAWMGVLGNLHARFGPNFVKSFSAPVRFFLDGIPVILPSTIRAANTTVVTPRSAPTVTPIDPAMAPAPVLLSSSHPDSDSTPIAKTGVDTIQDKSVALPVSAVAVTPIANPVNTLSGSAQILPSECVPAVTVAPAVLETLVVSSSSSGITAVAPVSNTTESERYAFLESEGERLKSELGSLYPQHSVENSVLLEFFTLYRDAKSQGTGIALIEAGVFACERGTLQEDRALVCAYADVLSEKERMRRESMLW